MGVLQAPGINSPPRGFYFAQSGKSGATGKKGTGYFLKVWWGCDTIEKPNAREVNLL
jgi:hypothetical protein